MMFNSHFWFYECYGSPTLQIVWCAAPKNITSLLWCIAPIYLYRTATFTHNYILHFVVLVRASLEVRLSLTGICLQHQEIA